MPPRQLTRTTYRASDNQPTLVERGSISGNLSEASVVIYSQVDTQYNDRRLAIRSTVSSGGTPFSVTQVSYDALNRETCTAARMNLSSLPTVACIAGTTGSDGPDRITRQHYDSESRVVRIEQGVGTSLVRDYATYTFTPNGQMASMVDARGYKASMLYDGFDRQSHWCFPLPNQTGAINPNDYELYTYDDNGNRTSLRKRDGSVITYQFDNLNRMTRKIIPERAGLDPVHTRDVFYQYDILGLQLRSTFDSLYGPGIVHYYDRYGRMTRNLDKMGPWRNLYYEYDVAGRRTEIEDPGGQSWSYSFNPDGSPQHITDPASNVLVDYNFNARGELADATRFGSAPDQLWTYDPIGRMASTTIDSWQAANDVTWSYTRNAASQIQSETQSNDSFSWDGFQAVDRTYTTNGLNQYVDVSGSLYVYDANGNLTDDGQATYLYDVENRLVEMRFKTAPSGCSAGTNILAAELFYDPMGSLYRTKNYACGVLSDDRTYLHDGDALVAEYNASGIIVARHIHGPKAGVDDPVVSYANASSSVNHARSLQTDARGSVVYSSDRYDGNAVTNTYDEYGQPSTSNEGRFQYTGQIWLPELGMYYYKARIYSPALGRFMQTDPIGYEDNNNLYGYVGQDPINGVDPTGMYTCGDGTDCEAVGQYRAALKSVARQTRWGSRIQNRAARGARRALSEIGQAGEDNGLTIQGDESTNTTADISENKNFLGRGNGTFTLRINFGRVREIADAAGVSENVVGAVTLGHEGIHKYQLRQGDTNSMAMEIQAYAIDHNIGLALGWDQNVRGLDRSSYLRRSALGSCASGATPGGSRFQGCESQGQDYLANPGR